MQKYYVILFKRVGHSEFSLYVSLKPNILMWILHFPSELLRVHLNSFDLMKVRDTGNHVAKPETPQYKVQFVTVMAGE